jgi:hypothetical protein
LKRPKKNFPTTKNNGETVSINDAPTPLEEEEEEEGRLLGLSHY